MKRVLLDQGLAPYAANILCEGGFDAEQRGPSVLLLRAQRLNARGQAHLVPIVFEQCEDALRDGAAISADRDRIRIRRLPLR